MSLFDSASLVVTPNGTKASKLYAIKPTDASGDLSVTRATTATRVNSSGLIESVATNVPRLDYTNSSCPSILVEPQRTNLLSYSEQFDNAYWVSGITVTPNFTTSPDGTNNADRIILPANIQIYNFTTRANSNYNFSLFVKKVNNRYFSIQLESGGAAFTAIFDLDTSTVTNTNANTSALISNVGNGWYRVTVLNVTSAIILFTTIQAASSATSTVGGSGTYYIWGAQLEAGSYPTSYIPTVASSVTRNADVISKTGISSLIGQTEGTLFWDINVDIVSGTDSENIINIDNGFFGTTLYLIKTSVGTLGGELYNGGVVQFSATTSITQKGRYKCALAYKTNDFALYINGVQIAIDSSGTVGAMSRLQLGQGVLGASVGNTNSAILWKTRLSNTELAQLTTI